jgi:hypothetical protein
MNDVRSRDGTTTKAVGFPVEAVAQARNAPMWPALGQFHEVAPEIMAPVLEEFFTADTAAARRAQEGVTA